MGIDPSLLSTGIAWRESNGAIQTTRIETETLRGPWRLHYARNQLERIVARVNPDIVIYEDYAMGKTEGRLFHIGELGGVFKELLWVRGIDIHLISPTALKKFVTGKGNPGFVKKGQKKLNDRQKKELISAALQRDFRLPVMLQNDEADAAGLLLMGEVKTGRQSLPNDALKSKRAEALAEFSVIQGKLKSISKQ